MTDGLRWQEVFRGIDPLLINKESGVGNPDALRKLYWREDLNERRSALMPFLWNTMVKNGQIYGNRDAGSDAYVTNGFNFSYPGYNETLTGAPDARVNSNENIPNKNVTVLEWLHDKPAFKGKVAAFGAWDVISAITNGARGGFPANAGYDAFKATTNPTIALLNRLKVETGVWDEEPFDAYPFYTALEYMKAAKPRVLYISLGETDEWAHDGKYELYLKSAHRVDDYLRVLWETVQSTPGYRDHTTLIYSPDHGRGDAPEGWKHHGEKYPDSRYIWMAFMGPDTPALGERKNVPAVTQSQVAATLAGLLGQDYNAANAKAGQAITDVRKH
ncbi:MAG: putative superfamily protein [Bryobacterales bacterium]|nr:putative superfamily protein [Bryobacterales bacterium]